MYRLSIAVTVQQDGRILQFHKFLDENPYLFGRLEASLANLIISVAQIAKENGLGNKGYSSVTFVETSPNVFSNWQTFEGNITGRRVISIALTTELTEHKTYAPKAYRRNRRQLQ